MREPDGYRDVLERITEKYPNEMLTVKQAAEISGYSRRKVTQVFRYGWIGEVKGKRIPRTTLARLMTSKE